jgi:hypothetical protein
VHIGHSLGQIESHEFGLEPRSLGKEVRVLRLPHQVLFKVEPRFAAPHTIAPTLHD